MFIITHVCLNINGIIFNKPYSTSINSSISIHKTSDIINNNNILPQQPNSNPDHDDVKKDNLINNHRLFNLKNETQIITIDHQQYFQTINSSFIYHLTTISKSDEYLKCKSMSMDCYDRLIKFSKSKNYSRIIGNPKIQVKNEILHAISSISITSIDPKLKKRLFGVLATVSKAQLIPTKHSFHWPHFLNFFKNLFDHSNDISLRIIGLQLMATVPKLHYHDRQSLMFIIRTVVADSLCHPTLSSIRLAALEAFCSFVSVQFPIARAHNSSDWRKMNSMLPLALPVICDALRFADRDLTIPSVIGAVINMITNSPGFLHGHEHQIIDICVDQCVADGQLSICALHIVMAIVRAKNTVVTALIKPLIVIAQYVIEAVVDAGSLLLFNEVASMLQTGKTTTMSIWLQAIGILTKTGVPELLNAFLKPLPVLLFSDLDQKRWVGLQVLLILAPYLKNATETDVAAIVPAVALLTNNDNAITKNLALKSICELSTQRAPGFQANHHAVIIPALISLISSTETVSQQKRVANALYTFIVSDCEVSLLSAHAPAIVSRLESWIKNRHWPSTLESEQLLASNVVALIGRLAGWRNIELEQHFIGFLGNMKSIVEFCNDNAMLDLRSRTIRSMINIGSVVGNQGFEAYRGCVIDWLLSGIASPVLVECWVGIYDIIGFEIDGHLALVVDLLLVAIGSTDTDMAATKEKRHACLLLGRFAVEMWKSFSEHSQRCIESVLIVLAVDNGDSELQYSLVELVARLAGCILAVEMPVRQTLWTEILINIMHSSEKESKIYLKAEILGIVGELISKIKIKCLNETELERLFENTNVVLQAFVQFTLKGSQKLNTSQRNNDIIMYLLKTYRSILEIYRTDVLPYFKKTAHLMKKLLFASSKLLVYGLCLFGDLLIYTGHDSWSCGQMFLPVFPKLLDDSLKFVRRAVIEVVGLIAVYGGSQYEEFLKTVCVILIKALNCDDCRNATNNEVTEIVVSTLTKICQNHPSSLPNCDVDQFLDNWLTWLPVYENKESVACVYGYLCHLVDRKHPTVVGFGINIVRILKDLFPHLVKITSPKEMKRDIRISLVKKIRYNKLLYKHCMKSISENGDMILKDYYDRIGGKSIA